MKMDDACATQVLFNIRLDSTFRYIITNSSGDCLAIVKDSVSSVVDLVSCDGTAPYAHGRLSWVYNPLQTPVGTFPYHASYNVSITDTTVSNLSLWILTMMSVKMNDGMTCFPPVHTTEPPATGLSKDAAVIIAVQVTGFVVVLLFLIVRTYCGHRRSAGAACEPLPPTSGYTQM